MNKVKTFICTFTDGTQTETTGTDKYLANEYFKVKSQLADKQIKEIKEK